MKTIVFAGPSIFGVERARFDGVEFRPPAACGDMLSAVGDGATTIGLIDGYYGDQVAVWHKEILFALSHGIRVAGAASMGALRAAECAIFGMVGIGAVYSEYVSGVRTSDADVAINHAPEELGFMPTSIALVDFEATVERIRPDLTAEEYARIINAGRCLHFTKRTWSSVISEAGADPLLLQKILGHECSVKREDAVQLLEWLQSQQSPPYREKPHWQFQNTAFFDRLFAAKQPRRSG